jgi:peptidoglycan/LPS O-acetylase OafA/YrhL
MSIASPVFAFALSLLAFLSIRLTFLFEKKSPPPMRFATINGLRGYLAFFVMLHHASIWYVFCRTGSWAVPESRLFAHLGQASVFLFFMITSFLFYDKLLNARGRVFDWRAFFIGRFFRITPLYLVVVMFVFLTVGFLSNWRMVESTQQVLIAIGQWLLFTIPTSAPINGVAESNIIVAGVTWSLRYEWIFYLALPLISLIAGQRPGLLMLAVSIASLFIGWMIGLNPKYALVFVGGIIAACLVRDARFVRFCEHKIASVLVLICLAVVLQFQNSHQIVPCVVLIFAFCIIAGGANMFGLFLLPTSHRFGELAYGIYLIHGIVLFTAISFFVGRDATARMSAPIYWLFVAFLALVTLSLAGLVYHYVEKPGIDLGKRFRRREVRFPVSSKA